MLRQTSIFFFAIGLTMILTISCRQQSEIKADIISYKYPDTISKLGLQKEFDIVSWTYFAGMNPHGYSCTDYKTEYRYSIVESNPELINISFGHDTISMGILDAYKDTINHCGPIGMFGSYDKENPHYIGFWIIKGDTTVTFRHRGLPVNYRRFNKEQLASSLSTLDSQSKQLMDTIRLNISKLSPWFKHIARQKGLVE